MQPYIFKMKNELALEMENFRKEMEDYSGIKPEIDLMKDKLEENKKACLVNQDENEKKFINYNKKYVYMSKQIEDLKQSVNILTQNYSNLAQTYSSIKQKIPDIEILNEKIENFDLNSDKYYKEIENNMNKGLDTKLELMQNQINNIKNTNNELSNKITSLNLNDQNIKNDLECLQTANKDLNAQINDQNSNMNNLTVNFNNSVNQIEKYKITVSGLEEKIESLNKANNTLNENISTLQLGFSTLANDFAGSSLKMNEINDRLEKLKTYCSSLQTELSSTGTSVKSHTEKIAKINSKFTEIEDKNDANMQNMINEKIKKCQLSIEELTDLSNGKFTSINQKISELSLAMSEIYNGGVKPSKISSSEREDVNFDTFRTGQTKYNDKFNQLIEVLSKQVNSLSKDIDSYDENFEKIQQKFDSMDGQMGKISNMEKNMEILSELAQTLSNNHKTLRNDVEQNFKQITEWETQFNSNINDTIEKLANDVDEKIRTEKIVSTMKIGRGLDSSSRSNDPSEMMNKIILLQDSIKRQNAVIDGLHTKYADRIAFEKHIAKFEQNENKLADLDAYIENKIYSLVVDESENKPSTYSKRNIVISDRITTKGTPIDKTSPLSGSHNQEPKINDYDQGKVSNYFQDFVLEGNPNQNKDDTDYFVLEGTMPQKKMKTKKNSIEILSSFGNNEKKNNNELYNQLDSDNLTNNKEHFDNYLNKLNVPSKNEPISMTIELGNNAENQNRVSTNNDNNYNFNDNESYNNEYISNKRESFNNTGSFRNFEYTNAPSNQGGKIATMESQFDDDDDDFDK